MARNSENSKLLKKLKTTIYNSVEELHKDISRLPTKRLMDSVILEILKNCPNIAKLVEGKDINTYDLKFLFINNLPIEEVKCPVCGKVMHTKNLVQGYNKTCSPSCGAKFSKQKSIKTCLEKYGVEHTSQIKESREKFKQTCLEKFGGTAPLKNKSIKEKMEATNMERYGAKSTLCKGTSIRKSIEATNTERYGGISPLSSEEVREKIKATNLMNYGVENPFAAESIRKNLQHRLLDQSYNNLFLLEEIEPAFSRDEWFGHNKGEKNSIDYKWKCKKCGNVFVDKINGMFLPRCVDCNPLNISLGQQAIVDFLKTSIDTEIITNDRTQLDGKEIDIWIPAFKIGIEFNGVYWHAKYPQNYHLNKTKLAESKGIHLIHIFEHEWLYKQDIIKTRLKNLFGLSEKIQARKCIVKEISIKDREKFLNDYHLQGDCKSSVNLGLIHNNEIIGVMTFGKPRFNKKYEWELIRYASSKNIVGGANKLLTYFERNWNPKSLMSYADRKWSSSLNNVYQRLGFTFVGESLPGYFYNKGSQYISRYNTQKKKLKKLLGEKFNENLSESENMFINGYLKLYDCGNLVFEKNYNLNNND